MEADEGSLGGGSWWLRIAARLALRSLIAVLAVHQDPAAFLFLYYEKGRQVFLGQCSFFKGVRGVGVLKEVQCGKFPMQVW